MLENGTPEASVACAGLVRAVGRGQVNFQLPMDNFQFNPGENIISVVKYDDSGMVLSWSAIQSVRPVSYNPGFLIWEGKLFLDAMDGKTTLYAAGLGFTDQWVKMGKIGTGTEKVMTNFQVLLDGKIVPSSATASSRWAGIYEVSIPTPPENATTLTVKVGDWQKMFILK